MKITSSIFKTFLLSLLIIAQVHYARAQTAALLPNASQVFLDNNGNPLSSGTVSFYVPGTMTSKMVWQDANQTVPWTQPITLNAAGRPPGDKGIYGNGTYRQIVKSSSNATIWDQPTAAVGTGGGSGTSIGDGNSVGTILAWSGMVAPNQYQFAYGQNLSRTTYPELLAATTLLTNVTCVGGNTTLTGISDTSNIPVGSAIEANCVVAGSTVISKTISTVTLSIAANISNTTSARFFPFGNGNGTTTFTVVDMRGKVAPGRTNMGGVTASNLTSTYYGSSPDAIGANGGSQSKTLITGNLPPYTPVGTIAITPNPHSHTYSQAVSVNSWQPAGSGAYSASTTSNTSSTSLSAAFTGTAQGGTSTAFAIIPPSITMNYIIKVTPDSASSSFNGVQSIGGMSGVISCGINLLCSGNSININSPIFSSVIYGGSSVNSSLTLASTSNSFPSGDSLIFQTGGLTRFGLGVGGFASSTFVISPDGTNARVAVSDTSMQLHYDNIPLSKDQYSGTASQGSQITWKTRCILCNGSIIAGSGGTPGTYTNVSLTGGSGIGAKATIVVSGGGVTLIWISDSGNSSYAGGNILSAAPSDIGGTVGFTYTLLFSGNDATMGSIGGHVATGSDYAFTIGAGGNFNHGVPIKLFTDTCDNPQAAGVTCNSATSRLSILGVIPNGSSYIGIGVDTPTSSYQGSVLQIHTSSISTAAMAHFTTGNTGSGASNGAYIGVSSDNKLNIINNSASDLNFGVNGGSIAYFGGVSGGLVLGAATGGDQGFGTINTNGVYVNDTSIALNPNGEINQAISASGASTLNLTQTITDTLASVAHSSKFTTQQVGSGVARTLVQAASNTTDATGGDFSILSEDGVKFISRISYSTSLGSLFNLYATNGSTVNTVLRGASDSYFNGGGLTVGSTTGAGTGNIAAYGSYKLSNKIAFSATAPTISSGFCTSPSISNSNGTAAFTVTVGTACAASSGVLTMPTANAGWKCNFSNITNPSTNKPDQTASTTTSVSITNYSRTTGLAGNWTASDIIAVSCTAY